jgi:hypothetical protein
MFFFVPHIGAAARVYFLVCFFFLCLCVSPVSLCIIHHVLMYICEPPRKYTHVCVSKILFEMEENFQLENVSLIRREPTGGG